MNLFYGGNEFGEAYHAAAFIASVDGGTIELRGKESSWLKTCEFLNEIRKDSCKIVPNKGNSTANPIGYSADEFLKRKFENLPKIVENRISSLLSCSGDIAARAANFASSEPSCFLWIRHGSKFESRRDMSRIAYNQLLCVLEEAGIRPIVVGSSASYLDSEGPTNLINFTLHDKN